MNESQVERLLGLLGSIAGSLATIERSLLPEAPNYKRPIADYADFDWSSIGAQVIKTDQWGVAQVEHNDQVYTRRAPENKFGEAIWFSRPDGKDADGNNRFLRLITFRTFGEAEPISRKAEALVQARPQDARQAAPAAPGQAQPAAAVKVPAAAQPPATEASSADFDALPSEGLRRTLAAEAVLRKLRDMAQARAALGQEPATPEIQQKVFNALRLLCGNSDEKRHQVLKLAFGRAHMNELTAAEAQALRDWVAARKAGNDWLPAAVAVEDLKALLALA